MPRLPAELVFRLHPVFIHRLTPGTAGHAEYLTAPLQNLILLPEGIGFELGAILEPSTVALHVLDRSGFRPAHQVAVFGAGAIGLCAVQWLRIKGARSIIAVDVVEENLEAARSLGRPRDRGRPPGRPSWPGSGN